MRKVPVAMLASLLLTQVFAATPAPQTVRPAPEQVRPSSFGMQPGAGQQAPASISCTAVLFSINAPGDGAGGRGIGRSSVSGITCKKPVDQSAMQLAQDAVTGRRLPSVKLTWQNQLEVQLENAAITSVQFTTDNGSEIVEISFSYQKAEISHPSSGTKITL